MTFYLNNGREDSFCTRAIGRALGFIQLMLMVVLAVFNRICKTALAETWRVLHLCFTITSAVWGCNRIMWVWSPTTLQPGIYYYPAVCNEPSVRLLFIIHSCRFLRTGIKLLWVKIHLFALLHLLHRFGPPADFNIITFNKAFDWTAPGSFSVFNVFKCHFCVYIKSDFIIMCLT